MIEHTLESVWDYPRPPRLEQTQSLLRIVHCGVVIAETSAAFRVLETSHPPVYYLPQADIAMHFLKRASFRGSFCEFKGVATYWDVDLSASAGEGCSNTKVAHAAWSYAQPMSGFAPLRDHLAFYANGVDECTVDGERVQPQPGDFYGGWITSWIKGPFKGAPGTMGW